MSFYCNACGFQCEDDDERYEIENVCPDCNHDNSEDSEDVDE